MKTKLSMFFVNDLREHSNIYSVLTMVSIDCNIIIYDPFIACLSKIGYQLQIHQYASLTCVFLGQMFYNGPWPCNVNMWMKMLNVGSRYTTCSEILQSAIFIHFMVNRQLSAVNCVYVTIVMLN